MITEWINKIRLKGLPTKTDTNVLVVDSNGDIGINGSITTVGTIETGVWNGTAIAHAYIGADAIETDNIADAQVTVAKLHADAIQTSGESFADNDTSLMTSAAIDDRINIIFRALYANSYITFLGQATMLSSGNWVMPSKSGISNHTWSLDSGVNTENNDSTAASIDRRWAQAGIRVPSACIIEGISCIVNNAGGNRQVTVGLFCSRDDDSNLPAWGTTSSHAPKLQVHADANAEGGGYGNKPTHAEVTSSNISMAAGDIFYPAIKLTGVTSSGNTDNVYATFSVHIKTPIS